MFDKVFNSTFDFFSHAVPGIVISVTLYLLFGIHEGDFLDVFQRANAGIGLFLLFSGYILGFAAYPIGRFLYRWIGYKIWKKRITQNIDIPLYDKYVLARQLSPANFKYVEMWNMYCALSHNLAVASLVILVGSSIKLFSASEPTQWVLLIILSLSLFFIFLHRAVVFSMWAANDLNATVGRLNLIEKAEKV